MPLTRSRQRRSPRRAALRWLLGLTMVLPAVLVLDVSSTAGAEAPAAQPGARSSAQPAQQQAERTGGARPARPAIVVAPAGPMPGEVVRVIGTVPTAKQRRAVTLQRKSGRTWVAVDRGRTTKAGGFVLATPMRWSEARLRVVAPAVREQKTRLDAVTTATRRVVRVTQRLVVALPTWAESHEHVTATVSVSPARSGRRVELQRRGAAGSTWTRVARGALKADGTASFALGMLSEGANVFRAVAKPFHKAPQIVSTPARAFSGTRNAVDAYVELGVGGSATVDLTPWLTAVTTLQRVVTADAGSPSVRLNDAGGLTIDAPVDQDPGEFHTLLHGVGCAGSTCDIGFTLDLTTTVNTLEGVAGDLPFYTTEFSSPSADRKAAAVPVADASASMIDEVLLTLGSDVQPGSLYEAQDLAQQVGALVTGGVASLGVFELRWKVPPSDLEAVMEQLRGYPGVASVEPSLVGGLAPTVIPSDWDDDGAAVRWPFTQMRLPQAWDLVPERGQTTVGIIDTNEVWGGHEDLDVVYATGGFSDDVTHGTHVAGLACAEANGRGVVGSAFGCPVVSAGIHEGELHKEVFTLAPDLIDHGARVINMSLGYNATDRCVDQALSDEINRLAQESSTSLRRLFNSSVGQDVVWVVSAGNNCGEGVHSPMGVSWALPNVVTVASSNSDGTLASYSNFGPGVEVAAGGGVGVGVAGGGSGPISTVFRSCGFLGLSTCSDYAPQTGTSMAAPLVAGVAALMRSAAPGATAADVGSCVVATAGTNTPTATRRSTVPDVKHEDYSFPHRPRIAMSQPVPVVDAEAAVQCVTGAGADAEVLVTGLGDRTSSGNGTDRGDLFAALTGAGYDVLAAESLPEDLAGFQQIWHIDTEQWSGAERDRVAAFVETGKGLYLTGERSCCPVNNSTIALVNRLVEGASVAYGGEVNEYVTIPVGEDAPYGLGTTPNPVDGILAAAPGSLSGVPGEHVVGPGGGGAFAAAWDGPAVRGGGRVAVVMDINWLAVQYRGDTWGEFVENLAHFLMTG